ncbi:MAG: ogr/Delta-like zinc finger family protein [Acinetobacter sp.]
MSKSIGIYCPHCETRMYVNGRKQPSPVLHKLVVTCKNPRCLASFSAHVEIVSAIHQSLTPDSNITATAIRNFHPWFKELEFLVQSIEVNPSAAKDSIGHIKGFISCLQICSLIDLSEAQQYTRRLDQLSLFPTDMTQ